MPVSPCCSAAIVLADAVWADPDGDERNGIDSIDQPSVLRQDSLMVMVQVRAAAVSVVVFDARPAACCLFRALTAVSQDSLLAAVHARATVYFIVCQSWICLMLAVYRSNCRLPGQLVDDGAGDSRHLFTPPTLLFCVVIL